MDVTWTMKKVEHRRVDAFELWCWRNLLRVLWTAWRSNQSILKKITAEYWKDWCWNWSSSTLVTWCEVPTYWKRPWCWERLKVGGEGGDRGWDAWMASPTQWTWIWSNSGTKFGWWSLVCCSSWGRRVGHDSLTEQQQITRKNQTQRQRRNQWFQWGGGGGGHRGRGFGGGNRYVKAATRCSAKHKEYSQHCTRPTRGA